MKNIDVLCVGLACYDLIFTMENHPSADVKMFCDSLDLCGGGPAANAAVTVARLGSKSAFCGYLGNDIFGQKHFEEFIQEDVNTDLILRGENQTPVSSILVKTNGDRAVVTFKGDSKLLTENDVIFNDYCAKVILFDGHEPKIIKILIEKAKEDNSITILDAGSLHEGTEYLMDKVDYLICSEKFGYQATGFTDVDSVVKSLYKINKNVIITLGERGLIYKTEKGKGSLPSYKVKAIDTTGAGDAFHGAFAFCLTKNYTFSDALKFSSAVSALNCMKIGARTGIPYIKDVENFLKENSME